ncbi:hypothetical protein BDR07DRAFT_1490299 [Suillus spraguei]|nr:hypothetical protein BDR07DRAFT_1490299 [Suillus spraguei]
MSEAQQLAVTKALAVLQSTLSAPVLFDKISSITLDDKGGIILGPLFTIAQKNLGGPYKLETDELFKTLPESKCTPENFSELFQLLSSLIPHFIPPPSYVPLVLHHPNLALRNIFFNPIDDSKITGLIDWGGAQILPLMVTAKFPDDLHSTGWDPCEKPGIPCGYWKAVPHDWTSFGDTSKWPSVFRGLNTQIDLTVRASAMIKRYYLHCYELG